ncbi:MAG: hypothetical protein ACFFCS_22965 [Candidatus Hodarchaeota archaeon]
MLVIKCAKCKKKLFQYLKIGKGHVLRCYKERISKIFHMVQDKDEYKCECGNVIGKDKPSHIQMRKGTFFYTGFKV